ncbi:MAG: hypothetical protein PHR83_16925 [Paludibacter sp.]|nr:hypothetical protein [Paludibacter sp.]
MEENINLIESLFERIAEYSKTSYELVKLNVVDKTSDVVSALMAHTIVKVIVACFMLFVNLGIAFWVGDMLGHIYYGFFAVATFYGFVAFILHFFMRKWMKRVFYDYLIRKMLS